MRDDFNDRILEARSLFDDGRFDQSFTLLSELISQGSTSSEAHLLMGVISAKRNHLDEAAIHLDKVLKIEPSNLDALNWLAQVRRASGDLRTALRLWSRAQEIRPSDPEIANNIGLCQLSMGNGEAAIAAFAHSTRLEPSKSQAHYNLGMAFRLTNRTHDAAAEFQRACSLDPDQPNNFLQVFKELYRLSRIQEAIETLEKGLRLHQESSVLKEALATAYGTQQPERAELLFRSASQNNPEAAVRYATWLQDSGKFPESVEVLERTLEVDPYLGSALRALAEAGAFQLSSGTLAAKSLAAWQRSNRPDRNRMHLAYALGKAYEKEGRFEESMRYFDQGNDLAYRTYPASQSFNRAATEADPRIMSEVYSQDLLNKLLSTGSQVDSPIFIVGMIRSGTTLLDQIVSSHPKVESVGEVPFWTIEADPIHRKWQNVPDPSDLVLLAERYLGAIQNLTSTANSDRQIEKVTDKMPLNFRNLGLIHLAFPDAKILHIRRDPLDTCLSIYTTFFAGGPNFTYNRSNIVSFYRSYWRLMEHWRQVIPRTSLYEIEYEELVSEPERVTRQVIDFCGLPWNDAALSHHQKANLVTTPSRWQVRQPIYRSSVERWRNFSPWLREFLELKDLTGPKAGTRKLE